jgi:hypothetical protein
MSVYLVRDRETKKIGGIDFREIVAQQVLIGCMLFILPFVIAAEHARQLEQLASRWNG